MLIFFCILQFNPQRLRVREGPQAWIRAARHDYPVQKNRLQTGILHLTVLWGSLVVQHYVQQPYAKPIMFPQAATSTKLGVYDPKAVRSPWTRSFQSLSSRSTNAPFQGCLFIFLGPTKSSFAPFQKKRPFPTNSISCFWFIKINIFCESPPLG